MPVPPEVVSALYRGLLGHDVDPAGAAFWEAAADPAEIVAALAATDRFRERTAALGAGARPPGGASGTAARDGLAAGGLSTAELALAAARAASGQGRVELTDLPAEVAPFAGLDAVPWSALGAGLGGGTAAVVGRFADELARTLLERGTVARAATGLADVGDVDLLVLTRGGDLAALQALRPELLRSVRRRVAVPLQLAPRRPADERAALRTAWRALLHACGMAQVSQVFRGRHGGREVLIDLSWQTPDHGVHLDSGRAAPPPSTVPAATWFIGDRAAGEDVA